MDIGQWSGGRPPPPETNQGFAPQTQYFWYWLIYFQVMLIGDSSVGKTCLLVRFKDGAFLACSYISTVGIDFRVRTFSIIANSVLKLKYLPVSTRATPPFDHHCTSCTILVYSTFLSLLTRHIDIWRYLSVKNSQSGGDKGKASGEF